MKKTAVWCITAILGGLMLFGMIGCKKDDQEAKSSTEVVPDVMLVDYYDAVVGTVGGDRHKEYVLYTHDKDHHRLSVFVQESPDESEIETVYYVPLEAETRAFEAIREAKLKSWVDLEDGFALDGGVTVVKFKDGDEYIRCATDNMPEDGERLLDSIGLVLKEYALERYLVEIHSEDN